MSPAEFEEVRDSEAYRNMRGLEVVTIDTADDIPRLVFGV